MFTSNRDGGVNQLFVVSLAKLTEDPNDPLVRERIRDARGGCGSWRRRSGRWRRQAAAAAASQVAPAQIELDGIEKRALQLTRGRHRRRRFFLSHDGRTIYFAVGAAAAGAAGAAPAAAGAGARRGAAAGSADDRRGSVRDRHRRTRSPAIAAGTFAGMLPTADRRAIFFRAAAGESAPPAAAARRRRATVAAAAKCIG